MKNIIFDSFEMDDDRMEEVESALRDYETDTDLMALCSVASWDGKRIALVNLSERNKTRALSLIVRSMMNSHSYITVKFENGDVVMEEAHHDGTNVYVFRKLRKNSTEDLVRVAVSRLSNVNFDDVFKVFKTRTVSVVHDVKAALDGEGGRS